MSPKGSLTEIIKAELRTQAAALPKGQPIGVWCRAKAAELGVHQSTIYRCVKDSVKRKRKKRRDAGESRAMEYDDLMDMAALVAKHGYDAELAIDTFNANRAQAGLDIVDVHPETFRRHLRQLGVSNRHNAQNLRHHRRWEAERPCQLWQIDSTVAESWYIDHDDTVAYESPVHRNKTKAGNGKPRIWLIAIVDDHTRVTWARFYTSNDALAWRSALIAAMRGPSNKTQWPAYGVPETIYTDQDSAMKSRVMTQFFEVFGIERKLANPSTEHETNAQAKGKVERAIRMIVKGFEVTLRAKRVMKLSELNTLLRQFLINYNNRVHSTTKVAPFERWLTAKEIRVLPDEEIVRRLSRREETRKVRSDLSIALEGKSYQLPRRAPFIDLIHEKVTVRYFETDLTTIWVEVDGEDHEIQAVEVTPDAAGEFKSSETPAAVNLKRELLKRDTEHMDPHLVHQYRRDRDPREYPIRPAERAHELTAAELPKEMIRLGAATDRAQAAGVVSVPPTPLERAALKRLFGDEKEIPASALKEWIDARTNLPGADAAAGTGV